MSCSDGERMKGGSSEQIRIDQNSRSSFQKFMYLIRSQKCMQAVHLTLKLPTKYIESQRGAARCKAQSSAGKRSQQQESSLDDLSGRGHSWYWQHTSHIVSFFLPGTSWSVVGHHCYKDAHDDQSRVSPGQS